MAIKHDTIADAIEAQAKSRIKSGTEGDRSFTQMSIDELIKADQHIAAKRAAAKPHFGLRMTKCIPPAGG